jgi:hypothetical protein
MAPGTYIGCPRGHSVPNLTLSWRLLGTSKLVFKASSVDLDVFNGVDEYPDYRIPSMV